MQTSGSVFADRVDHVKETKFKLELIEPVDCFLDRHDTYSSILVSFKAKSLWTNYFLNSKETFKNQLVVQMA